MPRFSAIQEYLELFATLSGDRQDTHLRTIIRWLLIAQARHVTDTTEQRDTPLPLFQRQ